MDEQAEKTAFAERLLKMPTEPFRAALDVFPEDTSRALWVSNFWPKDLFVQAEMERIRNTRDPYEGLPDKVEILRMIVERMEGTKVANGTHVPTTPDEFVKLTRLYCDISGFIEKPNPSNTMNVNVPRAIEVPVHGSDAEWEKAAQRQQAELLNVSRSRH